VVEEMELEKGRGVELLPFLCHVLFFYESSLGSNRALD